MAECARCSSPLENGDLRCCVCALPVVVDQAASTGRGCRSCGAITAVPPWLFAARLQTLRCGFCGWGASIETRRSDRRGAAARSVRRRPGDCRDRRSRLAREARLLRPTALALEAEFSHAFVRAAWVVNARARRVDGRFRCRRRTFRVGTARRRTMTFDDIVVPASRGMSQADASGWCRTMIFQRRCRSRYVNGP